ncbi:hypothetical protein BKA65DRAFT_507293 [Rhexocercosporidium sp. MPI-PUGE-AT-0058]|nr:hypothetical protein BKA65DRAFT_507293 [Rhexocercosporidium sp. MPI-PUGE-AT-0058]
MAFSHRPLFQDPGYDSVRNICASLGYKSETKTERHFKILSTKTASYRKSFLDKSPVLAEFPLSNVAPEVQACAAEFLDQYWHLFQDSSEARAFSWPIYPFDRSRILSGIAKLMCAQEYFRQKNMIAKDRSKEGDKQPHQSETNNLDSDADAPFIVDPTPSASVPDFGGKSATVHKSDSVFDGPSDSESESDSENEDDAEEMKKNIEIHLDYVYPLNHSRDGKSSDWLFTSEKCPDDVEPFAFRYLHEHNLYNSKADNIDAIHKFSKDLKQHLNVTCAPSKDHKIFKRCEQLVQRANRRWDAGGYGFLTKKNSGIRKTPVFEHAWMHHRKRWIEAIHSGITTGLLEIPSQSPSPPTVNSKRSADEIEILGDSNRTTQAGQSKRRSKESSGAPVAHNANHSTATSFIPSSDISVGVTRAPEAVMVNPVPGPQISTSTCTRAWVARPSPAAKNAGTSNGIDQPAISVDMTIDDHPPRHAVASASVVSSGLAGSNYNAPFHVDSPPPLKLEPLSPGLDSVANIPNNKSPSKAPSKPTSADTVTNSVVPDKPKLYFAIENSKGMPDTSVSQLVSGPTFRDSSISDFFALVATRSVKTIDELHDITLRYTWINQNAVVVNKYIGEEAWEDIKEDVLDFFRMSREDNRARRRFHIWVMTGDITKVGKSISRDDI